MIIRRLLVTSFLLAVLAFVATPAQACTVGMPGPLAVVVEEWGWPEKDGGIYEQETIARAPSILIRDSATASVVTRLWGRPPANVGVQYEGGEWFSFVKSFFSGNSCDGILDDQGNLIASDGQVGTVGYGPPPVDNEGPLSPEEAAAQGTVPFYRTAPILGLENGTLTGELSPGEIATLKAAYGPATVLEIPFSTRVQATIVVWWPTVLAFAVAVVVIGGAIYIIRARRKSRRMRSVKLI